MAGGAADRLGIFYTSKFQLSQT